MPIPGTTKNKNLEANAAAVHLDLTSIDLCDIDEMLHSVKVQGARYTAEGMKGVNV